MREIVPFLIPHSATRGAAISFEYPHEGATYPYPILITMDSADRKLVRDLTYVIHNHYDEFKDADPGSIGWAMNRQIFDWVVPYHVGAVDYFESIGVWSEHYEAHNSMLIERQQVLGKAWEAYKDSFSVSDSDFRKGWLIFRKHALDTKGFNPIGQK